MQAVFVTHLNCSGLCVAESNLGKSGGCFWNSNQPGCVWYEASLWCVVSPASSSIPVIHVWTPAQTVSLACSKLEHYNTSRTQGRCNYRFMWPYTLCEFLNTYVNTFYTKHLSPKWEETEASGHVAADDTRQGDW